MKNKYNRIFAVRTKALAVKVINTLSDVPYSDRVSVIRKQIFRSTTSVAAMCRARSDKEKYAKICMVVEAHESVFWLEVIEEINMVSKQIAEGLMKQALEILKVTSAYKNKLKIKAE